VCADIIYTGEYEIASGVRAMMLLAMLLFPSSEENDRDIFKSAKVLVRLVQLYDEYIDLCLAP